MLSGSIHAVLLTGPLDEGPYDHVLFWPHKKHDHSSLRLVARTVLRSRQTSIKTRNNTADKTREPLDALACPLFFDGKLFGVFAVEITHRPQAMQQVVAQQAQAGVKWLETMIKLHDATTREQLLNLVDLVATGLENEQFRVAATEVANELAERFDCQRVSFGFKRYNRIRIESISHTTKIDHQSNLVRLLRDAMNETMDQETTLVYPQQDENDALVIRCHAQLAKALQEIAERRPL